MRLPDVTAQSDAQRTVAILETLHALSEGHQTVLFTQEPEVLDWARATLMNADRERVIELPEPAVPT